MNWLKLVPYALPGILLGGVVWFGASIYYNGKLDAARIECASSITDVKIEQKKQVKAANEVTRNAEVKYQNDLASLGDELAAVKRMQPRACLPVSVRPAAIPHGAPAAGEGGQATGGAGIDSDNLLDYAASCERIRRQMSGLQDWVDELYRLNP